MIHVHLESDSSSLSPKFQKNIEDQQHQPACPKPPYLTILWSNSVAIKLRFYFQVRFSTIVIYDRVIRSFKRQRYRYSSNFVFGRFGFLIKILEISLSHLLVEHLCCYKSQTHQQVRFSTIVICDRLIRSFERRRYKYSSIFVFGRFPFLIKILAI